MKSVRQLLEVTRYNRDDVMDALAHLGENDADFCGDNGYEYRWDIAKEFETNLEYALSVAQKETTIIGMITAFVDIWMGQDSYYYDYEVSVSELNGIVAIAIAYITD
jgi:hypothetical protein